jgi:hypothetical protein
VARSEWELKPIRQSLNKLRRALAGKGGARPLLPAADSDLPVSA